jgi:hypothetical protein
MLLSISLIGSLESQAPIDSPISVATASEMVLKHSESVVAVIGIIAIFSALGTYLVVTRDLRNLSIQHNLRFTKELGNHDAPFVELMLSTFANSILLLFLSNHFEELARISVILTFVPCQFLCITTSKYFPKIIKHDLLQPPRYYYHCLLGDLFFLSC